MGRPYLLKKDTTSLTHYATLSGALAVLAVGLGVGLGSAGATRLGTARNDTAHVASIRISDAAAFGLGIDAVISTGQTAREVGSTPQPTSSYTLPDGSPSAPVSGSLLPAPQALRSASLSTTSRVVRHALPAGGASSISLSVRPLTAASDSTSAPVQGAAARKVDTVATGTFARLTAASDTFPDRIAVLSALNLERVLDRQVLAPATLEGVARVATSTEGLGLTLQRRADPAGLKLSGIEPGATQYLHSGQLPQPLAAATPEATPTTSGAGLTSPVSTPAGQAPKPASSSTSTATPVNMPGGNARTFYITGYTATGSLTATGTVPHWGTVAVDSSVIPLGSTVYIQGLGTFHAEDTGGAVVGDHVDVFVDSAAEAYQLTGYRLVSFVPPRH